MARQKNSQPGWKRWWNRLIAAPVRFLCMLLLLAMIISFAYFQRLPGAARANNVRIKDVLLRSIAAHRYQPFYVLKPEEELFRPAEIAYPDREFVTTKIGPQMHEHRSASSSLPAVRTVTPHTGLPDWELRSAREEMEAIFSPQDNPEQWKELLEWGKGLFQVWWALQSERIAYGHRDVEPNDGTEDEHLWFARTRLGSGDRQRYFAFPVLIELAHEAYPNPDDYQAAVTWAKDFHARLARLPSVTRHCAIAMVELPKSLVIERTVPPACEWTYCWILDQYLGLTERTRRRANERWLGYFLANRKDMVLEWGQRLERERREQGETFPPTSENLRLVCVVERFVGTDPYGIRCREIVHGTISDYGSNVTQDAILFGAYPNDEIYHVAGSMDRFKLFPYRGDLFERVFTRMLFLLMLAWGASGWLNAVYAERLLRLRDSPVYQRYRLQHKRTSSRIGLALSYLVIPGLSWLLAWWTLPLYLQVILEPWQLLIEVYLSIWFGGTILLLINQFIALTLMKFRIDPVTTWIDELISIPIAVLLLHHFGNDWTSIVGFVSFSLLPEVVARISRKPVDETPKSPAPRESKADVEDEAHAVPMAQILDDDGDFAETETPKRRKPIWVRVLMYTGMGIGAVVVMALIGSAVPEVKEEKQQTVIAKLQGHEGTVHDVVYVHGREMLVTAGHDKTVGLWRSLGSDRPIARLEEHDAEVLAVAAHAGKKLVASGSADKTIKIWSMDERKELATLSGHRQSVTALAFSPDGAKLISGSADNTIKIWSIAENKELATLTGHGDAVTAVAIHPNGKLLASSSLDATIRLWDLEAKVDPVILNDHAHDVLDVAFCPKGDLLASAGRDETIILRDVPTRRVKHVLEGHEGPVTSVAFSSDGKELVSGSLDGSARLWNVANGEFVARVMPEGRAVNAVAPYALFVAVAYESDGVTVWSLNAQSR